MSEAALLLPGSPPRPRRRAVRVVAVGAAAVALCALVSSGLSDARGAAAAPALASDARRHSARGHHRAGNATTSAAYIVAKNAEKAQKRSNFAARMEAKAKKAKSMSDN